MSRGDNSKNMLRVIGIDFGTSSTYMNVKRYDPDNPTEDSFNYIPVAFEHGESKGNLMSVIRENSDGTYDFGRIANEEMEGATIYRNFKMDLESPEKEEREKARELVSVLFKYLYSVYEQQLNQLGDEDDAVETIISYPVKWQEGTAAFMIQAAAEAGFENVRGMDEATAAISTVISRNFDKFCAAGIFAADRPGYLLLVDMGAGTTDLALCKYSFDSSDGRLTADSLNVDIVTNWPLSPEDPTFGGREIDEVLTDYVEGYLRDVLPDELQEMASMMVRTGNNVKLWKENNVSVNINSNKPVTTCGFVRAYPGVSGTKFPPLDRASFEKLLEVQLGDYIYLLRGCIEKACATDEDFKEKGLDLVILAGGHSSWYFSKDIVNGTMKGLDHPALQRVRSDSARIFQIPNPQATVALGLVYNRLLSSFNLKKPKAVIDSSWVKYLYNVKPNRDFFTQQYSETESGDLYGDVLDFTARFNFQITAEMEKYISIFYSNPPCRESFREKPFFNDKRNDLCFCAKKSLGSSNGFAVSAYGIYFESRMSNGCIPWEAFLNSHIRYTGWNADKIAVDSIVLPTNRQCTKMCMDYLKRLQRYLKKHI